SMCAWLVDVAAVRLYEDQLLDRVAGARIRLAGENTDRVPENFDQGLVLTREWFVAAFLDDSHSRLCVCVRARSDTPVGWGFTFEFDAAPLEGRWALAD